MTPKTLAKRGAVIMLRTTAEEKEALEYVRYLRRLRGASSVLREMSLDQAVRLYRDQVKPGGSDGD